MNRPATRDNLGSSRYVPRLPGRRLAAAAVALLAVAFLLGTPASAQVLPTPRAFVSNLDLECFKTNPYQPPPTNLTLRHLNPVLQGVPIQQVTLGAREQLCAPVAKNHQLPPPGVLEFIKYVDLSCYRIAANPLNRTLTLHHLNPVLQDLPRENVLVGAPQQLCVPVAKNNLMPPPEIQSLVSHIDLMCYGITPNTPMNRALTLTQLNPVLSGPIPSTSVRVLDARQLCVPVQKAGDNIPAAVLNIVRWIDLEKYDIVGPGFNTVTLGLRHLNPVLAHLPGELASLSGRHQLAVPVAKNGQVPPG